MREFFKPWRRKIGLVTLVLTCMFAAAWIRSLCVNEAIMYRSDKNTLHDIRSFGGGLIWMTTHEGESKIIASNQYQTFKESRFRNPFESNRIWSHNILGFEFGELRPSVRGMSVGVWVIRYSTFTIPLTLLSAWLLLSKPKRLRGERCGD